MTQPRRSHALLARALMTGALLGGCSVAVPVTVQTPAGPGAGSCAGLKGRPAAKLTVTVRASQGGPQADLEVTVDRAPMPGDAPRALSCAVEDQGEAKVSARTNAQGVAALANVRGGQVRVLAGAGATILTLAPGEERTVIFEDGKLVP